MNYYEMLNVDNLATLKDIKVAFLVKLSEVLDEENWENKVLKILNGYFTLTNFSLRKKYDAMNGKYSGFLLNTSGDNVLSIEEELREEAQFSQLVIDNLKLILNKFTKNIFKSAKVLDVLNKLTQIYKQEMTILNFYYESLKKEELKRYKIYK